MIFTMYKKERQIKKHHTNPYRAVNYIRDENGNLYALMDVNFFSNENNM